MLSHPRELRGRSPQPLRERFDTPASPSLLELDVGFKKLSPEDLFEQLPYAVGFAMLRSIKKSDFINPKDFTRLWNKAVDIASAAPDIGNYIPD